MILLPIVIWIFAAKLVGLPHLWIEVAVLIAAMPTGANAYLFAQRYETAIPAVSGAIAIGTAFALLTSAALSVVDGCGIYLTRQAPNSRVRG